MINRVAGLAKREEEYGLVSHAPGERKAIELVRRDFADQRSERMSIV